MGCQSIAGHNCTRPLTPNGQFKDVKQPTAHDPLEETGVPRSKPLKYGENMQTLLPQGSDDQPPMC